MSHFTVEQLSISDNTIKNKELLKQIKSLQQFYYDMGYDSDNIKTIFSLTISFLQGDVNKLVIKSFFDVLMLENRLNNGKEINLLNCFDDLIEKMESNCSPTLHLDKAA